MKRLIMNDLLAWKESKRRKPLVLRGARQVGKTWVLEEFGKTFPDGYVRFNFDRNPEYAQFFQSTKDVHRILQNLAMAGGTKITKDTLIIFDEIQACEEALNSLKYFREDAPEYYVASAGSLLGLMLSGGFPVGQVDFLEMGPMTFTEFLIADGAENFSDYLASVNDFEQIPDAFFTPLTEKLKCYFITGGMPEAVQVWTEERDPKAVDRVLSDILSSYESDFGKHAPIEDVPKIRYIWQSLPSQLARENKKFLYSVVKPGARAREYENALNWLKDADIIRKVYRVTKPGLPLSAYEDLSAFKIFAVDVGLLRRLSHLSTTAFAEGNRLFTEFKGALTENYVHQALIRQLDAPLHYWADAPHEVDFILQLDNRILPAEAKAGENVKAASIKRYAKDFTDQTPLIVRLSMRNLSLDGNVLNVPLFMTDQLPRLIELALNRITNQGGSLG
ncbi:MAG: ATP-binding protein [Oscillospiraceae bacterium]|nr:ATP-binding protein [Oscillospiraceae bacterium]